MFISLFWQELLKLKGTTLSMSTAYHPQSNGQSEVHSHCLEYYMHCFTVDNPKLWAKFLPLVKWSYNTSWHSSIKITPFEAVYGCPPPSMLDYVQGSLVVVLVDELLANRTHILSQLHANMQKAQLHIKNQADAHGYDISYTLVIGYL